MKILKYVCSILLLLFGAYLVFVGVAGSVDDAATYGRLEWHTVPPLPPRPEWPNF